MLLMVSSMPKQAAYTTNSAQTRLSLAAIAKLPLVLFDSGISPLARRSLKLPSGRSVVTK